MDVDLVVVGAGPAGLTLAWKTAQQGLRVAVVDQKPRADHVAYLTSASFMDVRTWDIPEEALHPFQTIWLFSRRESVEVPGSGWVLNRRKLLAALAQRAQQHGASLLFKTSVAAVTVTDRQIRAITVRSSGGDQELRARLFADCSGVGHVLERHLPFIPRRRVLQAVGVECLVPLESEPNAIDLYLGRHYAGGYGWLFPMDERTAILGYGTLDTRLFPHVNRLLKQMLALPRVRQRVRPEILEQHGGIFRTGKPLRVFHHRNLVIVGDVAIQGNPVIGEGIRFVMDAARIASDAIVQAVQRSDTSLLGAYSTAWRKTYSGQYHACYATQRLFYWLTRSDAFCDRAMALVRHSRGNTLLRMIRGEVTYGYVFRKVLKLCVGLCARLVSRSAQSRVDPSIGSPQT